MKTKNSFNNFWKIGFKDALKEGDIINNIAASSSTLIERYFGIKASRFNSIDEILEFILSEKYYRKKDWKTPFTHRLYSRLRRAVPGKIHNFLRTLYLKNVNIGQKYRWPVEDRLVLVMMDLIANIQKGTDEPLTHISFWPDGHSHAFVITHDIESIEGISRIEAIAGLEKSLGFRSSFNIVPEKYSFDSKIIDDLRKDGFEIGIHGLKHDGKLFSSYEIFKERSERINEYLREYGAVGFRSPLMHRNPDWMHLINAEYDTSFFDTDPFETIPGGTMSIWPFFIGNLVELPCTLAPDHILFDMLNADSPKPWIEKVEFIRKYHGMSLLNVHPDYLDSGKKIKIYEDFLRYMKSQNGCWSALPRDVTRWWRLRNGVNVAYCHGEFTITPNLADGVLTELAIPSC